MWPHSAAVEAAQRAADDPSKGVIAAFDRLIAQIDELVPPPPAVEPPPKLIAPADPIARLAAVTDLAVACAIGDPNVAPTAAQLAEDDDVLARIALEMASPDDDIETAPVAEAPATNEDTPHQFVTEGGSNLSLGQSLLAQGLVQTPSKPATDPFASLKRLTQSEKVALFT